MFRLKSFLWLLIYFYLEKRYGIKIANTPEEKEKIFKFRYKIYREELSHHFLVERKISVNDMLYDDYDFKDNTLIFYSGSIDKITGTLRLTIWDKDKLPQNIKNKYFIEDAFLNNVNRIGEFRFFQVERNYRKKFLALALVSYFYKVFNQRGSSFIPDIVFSDCQPGLLSYYFKTGCFLYTHKNIYEDFGILQIPLAGVPLDTDYLAENKCITYFVVKYYLNRYRKRPDQLAPNLPRLSPYKKHSDIKKYYDNIDGQYLKQHFDFLITLLDKLIVLTLEKDTIIIKKDILDYDAYLLIDGTLGVYIDNVLIAELKPGAIFGEMALLDEKHKRFTDVRAQSPSQVIVIPRSLLHQLQRTDPKSAIRLLYLPSNSISEKLASANTVLHELLQLKDRNSKAGD